MKISRFFLSGMGSGFLPKMPGTWGSFLALIFLVIFFGFLTQFLGDELGLASTGFWCFFVGYIFVFLLFLFLGIFWTKKLEPPFDKKWIVLDEWVGMMVACVPVFYFLGRGGFDSAQPPVIVLLLVGFLAFRFFDIVKILGVGTIDRKGTAGAVFWDDVLAGIYAGVVVICVGLALS